MSFLRNKLDSHITLNVERIDLNEDATRGDGDQLVSENQLHGIIAEAFEHLKSLSHPNVARYTNMLRLDGNVYLLFSEGYSMTLNGLLSDSRPGLEPVDFSGMISQLVCGLQYLHSSGLAHGRLTLNSVSVSDDGFLKISGYATNYLNRIVNYMANRALERGREACEGAGPYKNYFMCPFNLGQRSEIVECVKESDFLLTLMPYIPPELLFFDSSAPKGHLFWYNVDVWSLGICIVLTLSQYIGSLGHTPWAGKENSLHPSGRGLTGPSHNYEEAKMKSCLERLELVTQSSETRSQFVESFLFVSYLLVLVNRMAGTSSLSTIGLDLKSIVEGRIHPGSEESVNSELGVVSNLFRAVTKTGKWKTECASDERGFGEGKEDRVLFSNEEALELSMDLMTGASILKFLVRVTESKEGQSDSQEWGPELYHLLALAHDCLTVENTSRPSILDLCVKHRILKLRVPPSNCHLSNSWIAYRDKSVLKEGPEAPDTLPLESLKEFQISLSDSRFFLNYVGLENVLYYWTMLGNEPINAVPFQYRRKIHLSLGDRTLKTSTSFFDYNQTVEYFRRYKVGRLFLGELMAHVNLANLFPMIIEHQLRPSCVYARQHCFIYQLLRIRRFKRLLSNKKENRRQIFVEAMIDIPPLLRKQIWCNLLGLEYKPCLKDCPMSSQSSLEPLSPDVEQSLNFYNTDLLYSAANVELLLANVGNLKTKSIHQQLPSSIYSFAIPLLLLYHDSQVYDAVLDRIFGKYLKEFYDPTGSFVNNYLSEFSTILNFFDPEIAYHLRTIGAYADSYALPWFMSLFAGNTSVEQLYLIWDSILVQPKGYIKFLAAMIIHNVRERLLEITDASMAIAFLSCIMDSLNVPMLMYLTTHMYNTWSELLNQRVSGHKGTQMPDLAFKGEAPFSSDEGRADQELFSLDKSTFVFLSEEYPFERCFRISIETFSNYFSNCIIIDLRSVESYNLGHIPNSVHIKKVFAALSETDRKSAPISLAIFNDQSPFNTNMDFNANSHHTQTAASLSGLRNTSKRPWLHLNTPDSSRVVLAAGDGYDSENEMLCVQRLVFEFKLQHVCYYRINTEEWPKVFTLSKI